MGATIPDSIAFPDASYAGGFRAAMALMAGTIQDALTKRQGYDYIWNDDAGRLAQLGMQPNETGYQKNTDTVYRYPLGGSGSSSWQVWQMARRAWNGVALTPGAPIVLGTGGTMLAWYEVQGGRVNLDVDITFGTGGTLPSSVSKGFTVPLPPATAWAAKNHFCGSAVLVDIDQATNAASRRYSVTPMWNADGAVNAITLFRPLVTAAGDPVTNSSTGTGWPTLAAGDYLNTQVSYPLY